MNTEEEEDKVNHLQEARDWLGAGRLAFNQSLRHWSPNDHGLDDDTAEKCALIALGHLLMAVAQERVNDE